MRFKTVGATNNAFAGRLEIAGNGKVMFLMDGKKSIVLALYMTIAKPLS